MFVKSAKRVFALDVPGIHAFLRRIKTWMAGTSPAMTKKGFRSGSALLRIGQDKPAVRGEELP
jgi:hypothetical protein